MLTSCAMCTPVIAPADVKESTAASSERRSADEAMREAYSAALQGDGRAAVGVLATVDPAQLSERNRTVRSCMIDRLDGRHKPDTTLTDHFVSDVTSAYQEYWLRSLRAEQPAAANESALLATLNSATRAVGGKPANNLDDLESTLASMIRTRGYHSLHGMTLPLREFMLWKVEDEAHYEVSLPQGSQPVTVVFMDGFVSLGWAGFATCDSTHTGGWTKPDRLYAVRSAYDLDSESFHVSYLAHEAQHFADNAAFPQLEQPELEFRAKLTELAISHDTIFELLQDFALNRGADRGVPHSFADSQVVDALEARLQQSKKDGATNWRGIGVERINAAAKALLQEDTEKRRKEGRTPH
jgi:hypothetical protein